MSLHDAIVGPIEPCYSQKYDYKLITVSQLIVRAMQVQQLSLFPRKDQADATRQKNKKKMTEYFNQLSELVRYCSYHLNINLNETKELHCKGVQYNSYWLCLSELFSQFVEIPFI